MTPAPRLPSVPTEVCDLNRFLPPHKPVFRSTNQPKNNTDAQRQSNAVHIIPSQAIGRVITSVFRAIVILSQHCSISSNYIPEQKRKIVRLCCAPCPPSYVPLRFLPSKQTRKMQPPPDPDTQPSYRLLFDGMNRGPPGPGSGAGSGTGALPGQGNHLLNRRTRGAGGGPSVDEEGEFDFQAGLAKFDKEKVCG